MRHLFTLTTFALFLSTAAYAAEVCDPDTNKNCVCEKVPVMSKDGKRILYHTMNNACMYTTSGGSSLFTLADVKPNPGPNPGPGPGPKPDHDDDDDDDHDSDDDNDDDNDHDSADDTGHDDDRDDDDDHDDE